MHRLNIDKLIFVVDKVLHSRSLLRWTPKMEPDVSEVLGELIQVWTLYVYYGMIFLFQRTQQGVTNMLMHRRGAAAEAERCV